MKDRNRLLLLSFIMATVALSTMGITIWLLYRNDVEAHRAQLVAAVQRQAGMIRAMGHSDLLSGNHLSVKDRALAEVLEAEEVYRHWPGLAEDGEVAIFRRVGGMLLIVRGLGGEDWYIDREPYASGRYLPIDQALNGRTGSLITTDHRGKKVLAAYAPVPKYALGVVATTELSKIQAPFLKAGIVSGLAAILAVLLGTLVFLHLANPLLRRLEESQIRARAIVETTADGVVTFNETGVIESVNPAAERILDYPPSELVGRHVETLLAFPGAPAPKAGAGSGGGNAWLYESGSMREVGGQRKDGTRVPLDVSVSAMLLGQRRLYTAWLRDITERKQAEERLWQQAQILDQIHDAIITTDPEGRVIRWNKGAEQLLGWTAGEITGQHIGQAISQANPGFFHDHIRAPLWAQGNHEFELDLARRSGPAFHGYLSLSLLRDPASRPVGIVLYIVDITARRKAEMALQKSQAGLAMAQRIARLGNWDWDIETGALSWSDEIYRIFGVKPWQFTATYSAFLSTVHPEDRALVEERVRAAVEDDEPYNIDHRIVLPDGVVRVVNEQGEVFRDAGGVPVRMMGVVADVTERRQAEEALRASRRLLQMVFDTIPVGVYVKDRESRYLLVNRVLAGFQGLRSEQMLGLRTEDLPFPNEAEKEDLLAQDRRVLASGETVDVPEVVVTRSDGVRGVFHVVKVPLLDSRGNIEGLVGLADEITERKRSEIALRDSEERFRNLAEGSIQGILIQREDGSAVFANQAFADIHGFDAPEDILALDSLEVLVAPHEREHLRRCHADYLGGEPLPQRFEFQGRKKDGSLVWLENYVKVVEWDGRKATQSVRVDITERKTAEEERSRLAAAVEQAADNIFITDTDGVILYANIAFEHTTGYAREEVIGRKPSILKSGVMDPERYREMWAILLRGEVWFGQYTNRKKDGSHYEVEATNFALRNAAGKITHFISIQRDITRQMQMEAQLRRAQRMEAIGSLAGGIAHDFNNLLVPILGYTEMTLKKLDPEGPLTVYLNAVLKAANRGKDLISQILLFSRQNESARAPLSPKLIVTEVVSLMRSTLPKTITIREEIASDLTRVHVNSTQMHQVLMNLCINAGQAMPSGGELNIVCGNAELHEHPVYTGQKISGRFVRISVADTGMGMDSQVLAHIFEPFFTTKEVGAGTGLGLSTVYGIVEQHGGYLDVFSRPEEGSRFDLYLPALEEEALPAPKIDVAVSRGSESVLFVDDEQAICDLGVNLLGMLGYQVHAFTNGQEALEAFQKNPGAFDLLVVDQMMPDITGDQLVREVRKARNDLPVILCSGYGMSQADENLADLKIDTFLQKPIGTNQLSQAVRSVLNGRLASEAVA